MSLVCSLAMHGCVCHAAGKWVPSSRLDVEIKACLEVSAIPCLDEVQCDINPIIELAERAAQAASRSDCLNVRSRKGFLAMRSSQHAICPGAKPIGEPSRSRGSAVVVEKTGGPSLLENVWRSVSCVASPSSRPQCSMGRKTADVREHSGV
jgi:hypothetical protein